MIHKFFIYGPRENTIYSGYPPGWLIHMPDFTGAILPDIFNYRLA